MRACSPIAIVIPNESDRCAHLRQTVNMLPSKHRDCLEFLMFHLARVASRERENLVCYSLTNVPGTLSSLILFPLDVPKELGGRVCAHSHER